MALKAALADLSAFLFKTDVVTLSHKVRREVGVGGGQTCQCSRNSIKQTVGCLQNRASMELNRPSKKPHRASPQLSNQPVTAILPLPLKPKIYLEPLAYAPFRTIYRPKKGIFQSGLNQKRCDRH